MDLLLSQQLLKLSNVCEDAHATRQLHCQWRSGPFHAKRAANAAITFYAF